MGILSEIDMMNRDAEDDASATCRHWKAGWG